MADNINTAQINQAFAGLTQEVQSMTSAIRTLLASQSNLQAAHAARERNQEDLNNDLADFAKQLRAGRKTNVEQEKLIHKAVEAKRKELEAQRKLQKAVEEQAAAIKKNKSGKALDRLTKNVETAQDAHQHAAASLKKYVGAVDSSFKGLIKGADWAGMALTWFGTAVQNQAKQLLTQNKANGGLVEGTGSLIAAMAAQQNEALKYKVDATTFANLTNGARQMFNAMGGTAKGLQTIGGTVDNLSIAFSDFGEGLRVATQWANDFANKGIKPTSLNMQLYEKDITTLRRQTGLSIEQAHELFNNVASDVESIDILRSARADEREAILRSQRALIQQSIAAGMSAEQAKEAAKMLNKMVAAKPLDRLKQAAKVRALSGAMGIAGGEEAAQAITVGKRATPEQQRMLQEFSNRAANAMDQAAGQGLGTEIFATTLLDKLDLEQYYGKNSQFSTTLGDSLKSATGDLSQKFVDATKDPLAKTAANTLGILDQIKLVVSGQHWLGVIAAGVGVIVTTMMGKGVLNVGGKLLGNLAGKVGIGGAVAESAGAASAAGGAAATGGRLAAAGKLAAGGAVMGAAAYGIDAAAGKLGVGKKSIDEEQDEANWKRMSMLEKAQSGLGRSIEKIGSFVFLDNISNEARSDRIANETKYLNNKNPKMLNPVPQDKANAVEQKAKEATNKANPLEEATNTTADAVTQQVKKMDASNDLLKSMVELMQKQNTLAEKQLAAQLLTDKEKTQEPNREAIRNNRFGSQYGYVS